MAKYVKIEARDGQTTNIAILISLTVSFMLDGHVVAFFSFFFVYNIFAGRFECVILLLGHFCSIEKGV